MSRGAAAQVESAMGPALQAAFLVMQDYGGKLLLFQSAVPSLGARARFVQPVPSRQLLACCAVTDRALYQLPVSGCSDSHKPLKVDDTTKRSLLHPLPHTPGIGKVKNRDNAALWGTDQEHKLRTPDDPFYKKYAAEASRVHIAVDVFALGCAPLMTHATAQGVDPVPELSPLDQPRAHRRRRVRARVRTVHNLGQEITLLLIPSLPFCAVRRGQSRAHRRGCVRAWVRARLRVLCLHSSCTTLGKRCVPPVGSAASAGHLVGG